jgi:hypothetical protein
VDGGEDLAALRGELRANRGEPLIAQDRRGQRLALDVRRNDARRSGGRAGGGSEYDWHRHALTAGRTHRRDLDVGAPKSVALNDHSRARRIAPRQRNEPSLAAGAASQRA